MVHEQKTDSFFLRTHSTSILFGAQQHARQKLQKPAETVRRTVLK